MSRLTAGPAKECHRPSSLPGRIPFITVIDGVIKKEVQCGKDPKGYPLFPSADQELKCSQTKCIYNANYKPIQENQ